MRLTLNAKAAINREGFKEGKEKLMGPPGVRLDGSNTEGSCNRYASGNARSSTSSRRVGGLKAEEPGASRGFKEASRGFKGLQRGFKGLQGSSRGFKGLQEA